MYRNKTIAVVVPAYNEETLIGRVITTMPELVDTIIIVDDFSTDRTAEVVEEYRESLDRNIDLIRHDSNQGVGAAIMTGYKKAVEIDEVDEVGEVPLNSEVAAYTACTPTLRML